MNLLAENIRTKMKELGLTQSKLAELAGTTQVTINRLLSGKIKKTTKIIEIAKALKCDPDWLLNGQGPSNTFFTEQSNVVAGPELHGLYPVISWVQAGDWSAIHEVSVSDAIHYPCPVKCSDKTFLLHIQGLSMSPKFDEGDLIFVDPAVEPINGKYVVARLDDENEATFKQLIIEGGHKFLKAANPAWPTQIQPINGNCTIVGVVIFVGREL
jgi:SOS-response transcriptional repressor LexA